jgi:hypothetical protein
MRVVVFFVLVLRPSSLVVDPYYPPEKSRTRTMDEGREIVAAGIFPPGWK